MQSSYRTLQIHGILAPTLPGEKGDPRAVFNEFEFILSPESEYAPHYWICQDCSSVGPDDVIRTDYVCDTCGSHTLGPFRNPRECAKAYYACKEAWDIYAGMMEEDGIETPGLDDYINFRLELEEWDNPPPDGEKGD